MKHTVLILAILFGFVGCAAIGIIPPPSVCDSSLPGESMLCDIAKKNDLHLETIGNIFIGLNVEAINMGAYTRKEALSVIEDLRYAVNFNVTGADLFMLANEYIRKHPILLVASPYIGYVNTPKLITDKDRKYLNFWFDEMGKTLR